MEGGASEPLTASSHTFLPSHSCSQLQYLYASLGQKGGAVWRTALAALKAQYEQQFKYTGKV